MKEIYIDYINAIMVLTRMTKNSCMPPTTKMLRRYNTTEEKILEIAREDFIKGKIREKV
jgi:hypothetical protein